MGDAPPDLPPVRSPTASRRAAQAHAARPAPAGRATALPGQVGPGARQAWQPVFVLRQLHLQRAFARARMLREDIQDQRGAIQHLDVLVADSALELALLRRRELLIEDHDLRAGIGPQRHQFLDLARADQGSGVRAIQLLLQHANHLKAGCFRKPFQLHKRILQRPGRLLAL